MSQKKHNRSENRRNKKEPGFSVFSPESWSERRLKWYTPAELFAKKHNILQMQQNIHNPVLLRKINHELLTIKSILS